MNVAVNDNGMKTWYYKDNEVLPTEEIELRGDKFVPKEGEFAIKSDMLVKYFDGTEWIVPGQTQSES